MKLDVKITREAMRVNARKITSILDSETDTENMVADDAIILASLAKAIVNDAEAISRELAK